MNVLLIVVLLAVLYNTNAQTPTVSPTDAPSKSPTKSPTGSPTAPTLDPTASPSESPTKSPTISSEYIGEGRCENATGANYNNIAFNGPEMVNPAACQRECLKVENAIGFEIHPGTPRCFCIFLDGEHPTVGLGQYSTYLNNHGIGPITNYTSFTGMFCYKFGNKATWAPTISLAPSKEPTNSPVGNPTEPPVGNAPGVTNAPASDGMSGGAVAGVIIGTLLVVSVGGYFAWMKYKETSTQGVYGSIDFR